jgi:hypothetical protein
MVKTAILNLANVAWPNLAKIGQTFVSQKRLESTLRAKMFQDLAS